MNTVNVKNRVGKHAQKRRQWKEQKFKVKVQMITIRNVRAHNINFKI